MIHLLLCCDSPLIVLCCDQDAWNSIGLLIQAARGNATLEAPLPPLHRPAAPLPSAANAPHCVCLRSNVRRPGSNATCPWP